MRHHHTGTPSPVCPKVLGLLARPLSFLTHLRKPWLGEARQPAPEHTAGEGES